MSNLTLIVDNRTSLKHRVLQNLKDHDGKPVSMFCAIRNIDDTSGAIDALNSLNKDGLIERSEVGPYRHVFYRFKSELALYRQMATAKTT